MWIRNGLPRIRQLDRRLAPPTPGFRLDDSGAVPPIHLTRSSCLRFPPLPESDVIGPPARSAAVRRRGIRVRSHFSMVFQRGAPVEEDG